MSGGGGLIHGGGDRTVGGGHFSHGGDNDYMHNDSIGQAIDGGEFLNHGGSSSVDHGMMDGIWIHGNGINRCGLPLCKSVASGF